MRKGLLILAIVFVVGTIGIGYISYNFKMSKKEKEAIIILKDDERKQKEEKKKERDKIEENKTKHVGETLVYSPMGDSLSEGYVVTTVDKRFINVLAGKIKESFGYEVSIQGAYKSGGKLSALGISSVETIEAQKPNLVTIEFGTNDSLVHQDEASIMNFEHNLRYVIDRLKSGSNPQIVLVTTWNLDKSISQLYDNVIEKVGKEYGIPVANISSLWTERTDTIQPKDVNNFLNVTQDLEKDNHPNDLGHAEIANEIFKYVYTLLDNP